MINLTQTTYSKGKNDEMLYHKLIPAVAFDYADGDALIESENKVKFVIQRQIRSLRIHSSTRT